MWRRLKEAVLLWIVPRLIWALVQVICRTLRLEVTGQENLPSTDGNRGAILVSWHHLSMVPCFWLRNRGVVALISSSRHGEFQNRIFQLFGWDTLRGSTRKNAVTACLAAARQLRAGAILGLTPDGPIGPSGKCQPGCVLLAMLAKVPIVPLGVSFAHCLRLSTWDRYAIPLPFTKACLHFGRPLLFKGRASQADVASLACQIDEAIDGTVRAAAEQVGAR